MSKRREGKSDRGINEQGTAVGNWPLSCREPSEGLHRTLEPRCSGVAGSIGITWELARIAASWPPHPPTSDLVKQNLFAP